MTHHPIFEGFCFSTPIPERGWRINGLGVRQRTSFDELIATYSLPSETALPAFDDEYFEWVDILEAVSSAEKQFTMIELGAGYGRWLVNAAVALRQIKDIPCRLVAVEAEPTHFAWVGNHLADNGLAPQDHLLIEAAVAGSEGKAQFLVGKPSEWYGQALYWPGRRERLRRLLLPFQRTTPIETKMTRTITLPTILVKLDGVAVDLIDMDVQGEEGRVITSSRDALNRQVRRVHIGTHSATLEDQIRRQFSRDGWQNVNDYPCNGPSQTPYGIITFQDGVQTWLNPALTKE